jgi:hypothetical protein
MLDRKYTVYFDTQFYVQLCRTDKADADQIIRDLNALNVRHVISNVLIRELLTSRNRTNLDEVLVQRVRQFKLPPYCADADLAWEVLLLSGQERVDVANTFRELHDQMAVATSNSIMARREMNPEQQAELLKANRSALDQLGFPEDFQRDQAQVISAAKGILNMLGLAERIQWPENATPADLLNLSEQIKGILDPSEVAFVEEHNRIQNSSTRSEDRPYQVTIGTANPKTTKRLSNTLRDTEHMLFFVQHQNEIDLLQVDKAQHAIMNQSSPKHRLSDLGLAHRCFSADTPLTAITKVRDLMAASRKQER